jgi:hypothetical protein
VLQETKTKGIYCKGLSLSIDDVQLIAYLIESILHAKTDVSARLADMLDSTSLFPFRLKRTTAQSLLIASPRLDYVRQHMNDDLVMLKK